MKKSANYDFWLPEAILTDDANIEQISENFGKLDIITKTPIAIQSNSIANSYQLIMPFKALNNGTQLLFIPLYDNTGAATLEILANGVSMGIKKIVNSSGAQIDTAYSIRQNQVYLLRYNAVMDDENGAFELFNLGDATIDPLTAQTITYDDYGRPITVTTNFVTYQITYNSDGTLNTISNGAKTMQAQYNEWGQFIGTVIL